MFTLASRTPGNCRMVLRISSVRDSSFATLRSYWVDSAPTRSKYPLKEDLFWEYCSWSSLAFSPAAWAWGTRMVPVPSMRKSVTPCSPSQLITVLVSSLLAPSMRTA